MFKAGLELIVIVTRVGIIMNDKWNLLGDSLILK